MPSRADKLSVLIAASPAAVYEFASNPINLPKWAAGLAGAVKIEFAEDAKLVLKDLAALKKAIER